MKVTNLTEIYSLTNEKNSKSSSAAPPPLPLSDYINNLLFQKLISGDDYFELKSDEIMYLDHIARSGYVKEAEKIEQNDSKINIHIMLKEAPTKKLRLRVWAYSFGEYLYILSKNELTLTHRTYTINQTDDYLLE